MKTFNKDTVKAISDSSTGRPHPKTDLFLPLLKKIMIWQINRAILRNAKKGWDVAVIKQVLTVNDIAEHYTRLGFTCIIRPYRLTSLSGVSNTYYELQIFWK